MRREAGIGRFDSAIRGSTKALFMQSKRIPANAPVYTLDLLETAAENGSFGTFGKAIELAGLGDTLRGIGPFTIFAPTDAAFEAIPADRREALFQPENKPELAALLNYHLLRGQQKLAELGKWDAARTMHGQMMPIARTSEAFTIDGANVVLPDIGASNGVLHGIDTVNVPGRY
jgi:uncharacterized surface protein with fasciclin (FAS1) repeats